MLFSLGDLWKSS